MRLVLLNYGIWHDRRSALKFTDIDYFVFSDASKYVSIGMSPYMRDTYRYTPMLAILLLPTQYGFPSWGKYLFSISDLIAGWLMIKLLSRRISYKRSLIYSSFWILNPFVAIISTRGNCEAILGILSIALLYLIEKKSVWLASLILGFSVHFKIYPFMYGIAFLVYFSKPKKGSTFMEKFLSLLSINQLKIVVGSLFMFTICNLLMYYLYGSPFLEHTYLYHFGRTDHRHNFSLHHLNLYYESSFGAKASSLFAFLPQLSLCMLIPLVFGKKNLPGTLFAQTFAFVTFNKVCTSQYFMWYLVFLPLVLPNSKLLSKKGLICLSLWIIGQLLWLISAYNLEMLGKSVFIPLWLSGLLFFFFNVYELKIILDSL
uniref:GPI mannosyltransferase 1 n=2 Tax=Schizosaccharomyces pombe TaxID=4896 RepID=GPI14_SCHPO|nr:RecName: Full=GPI mannosyltransferase 1; AltName: Full=GPI mannosyltransferase I; Short=GPI-MT-I; AltName: Full=Glycosylphosphatidylinositol-anchor biosynthesis protein 14 [Schizosaccharomyces pombe 972h-]